MDWNNILVVPTIREDRLQEFLEEWGSVGDWHNIIVVEDNPTKQFNVPGCVHYSWAEIREELGDLAGIFSKRDSAIRSFGFWKAWDMEADFIFTLDDDCYPLPSGNDYHFFCNRHIQNMEKTPRWTELIPQMRTRGLPYFNRGKASAVMANVGLWCGVPDLDAVATLANGIPNDFQPPAQDRLIPAGQYFPWCGMNFAFRREFAVLAYFPLMGTGSPYSRFDDIWFGVIAKRVCDHLGWRVSCGRPFVRHRKASDTMTNLVKEAPGIKANEQFWEVIDKIPLSGQCPHGCMTQVGNYLVDQEDGYLKQLGDCILKWVTLFQNPS